MDSLDFITMRIDEHFVYWMKCTLFLLCIFILQSPLMLYHVRNTSFKRYIPKTYPSPYQIKMKPGLFEIVNPTDPKYPLNVKYLLENKDLCSSVSNLTFLVMILSSTTSLKRRQTIRQTWGNESMYTSYGTIKVLFLLGISQNASLQAIIDVEFNHHGDIVQGDFIDTYNNLTHKSTMGFKWATERCRNAKYVIKTDDDVVINLFDLFKHRILKEAERKTHVLCHRQSTMVIRDNSSKWNIEPHQFKGYKRFDPYCGGLFVMIVNELVPFLYKSVSRSPFFYLEDVLLYGIALDNIPGLNIEPIRESLESVSVEKAIKCLQKERPRCPLYVFMTVTLDEIRRIWTTILKFYKHQDKQYV